MRNVSQFWLPKWKWKWTEQYWLKMGRNCVCIKSSDNSVVNSTCIRDTDGSLLTLYLNWQQKTKSCDSVSRASISKFPFGNWTVQNINDKFQNYKVSTCRVDAIKVNWQRKWNVHTRPTSPVSADAFVANEMRSFVNPNHLFVAHKMYATDFPTRASVGVTMMLCRPQSGALLPL